MINVHELCLNFAINCIKCQVKMSSFLCPQKSTNSGQNDMLPKKRELPSDIFTCCALTTFHRRAASDSKLFI